MGVSQNDGYFSVQGLGFLGGPYNTAYRILWSRVGPSLVGKLPHKLIRGFYGGLQMVKRDTSIYNLELP